MSWFSRRKEDIEVAVAGSIIGWEAHKAEMEEIDWQATVDFLEGQGIDVDTRYREFILNKAMDLGFGIRNELS